MSAIVFKGTRAWCFATVALPMRICSGMMGAVHELVQQRHDAAAVVGRPVRQSAAADTS